MPNKQSAQLERLTMGNDPMFLSTSPRNWRGVRGQVNVLRTLRRARVLELDHPVWERPLVLGKRDECHYGSHSAYLRKLRIGVKASQSLSDSFINSRVNVQFAEGERAIKEGHAITDIESPSEETIAFWKQADASMHTKHAIRMRLELRRHPMVRESLHNFWSALMSAGFDAGQTPSELNFSAYAVMMKAIYGELIGSVELGAEDLEKSIADDWSRDCKGNDCLTRELLLDSMFELVDVWEHGSRPIDYANWLSRLSGVVCKAFDDLKTGQIEVRQAQGGSNRGCAGTSPTSRHAQVSSGPSVFGGQSQAGQGSAGMSPMGSRAGKRGVSTNANARSSGGRASNTAGKLDAKTRDATRDNSISSIEGDQRIKKAKGRAATVLESGVRAMHARERRRERKDAAGTIGRVARGCTTRSRVIDVYIGGVDAKTRQKSRLDLYISQPSTPGMKGVKQRWALRKRAAPIAENQRQLAGRNVPTARSRPQEFQLMTAYYAPVQAGHFVSHRPSSAVARLYSPPSTSNTRQTPNTEDEHMNFKRPTSYRSISDLLSILLPDPAPKSPLKAPPKILVPQQVKPQLPARWKAQSTTSLIYTNTPTPWPQARTVSRDKRLLARTFSAEKQTASTHGVREAQMQFLTISPRSQTLFHRSRALQTVSSMPHLHTFQSPSQTLPSSTSHIQSGLRESEMRSLTRNLLQYEENLSSANREVALRPSSHASQRAGAWKSVPMPPPNSPPSPMSQRRAVMGSTAPVFALKHPYGHPVLSPGGSAT